MSYCVPPPAKILINKDFFSRPILDSLAAGSRQKKLSDRDVGLLALALVVFLYPTTLAGGYVEKRRGVGKSVGGRLFARPPTCPRP
jgi:hypothetical protein